MNSIAQKAATKMLKSKAEQYQPVDPYYEEVDDGRGGKKKVKRAIPPGLSKRDQRLLKKIRKRAHYLDKGMNLCGFRVGWTFWIGFVPFVGDITDALLNYTLVVKPAKQLDIPDSLLQHMLVNNAISAGLGFIPVIGDIGLAAFRANSRNAHLVEAFLVIRGQEYLATLAQGPSAVENGGVPLGANPADVKGVFKPGSGMAMDGEQTVSVSPTKKTGTVKSPPSSAAQATTPWAPGTPAPATKGTSSMSPTKSTRGTNGVAEGNQTQGTSSGSNLGNFFKRK
ncbi:hypothetical protein M231_00658 [Tremella mesenterica]|uniref:PH domain-containing protein n=1 Tax=Tremella mesenterica TaxID=5217 RepID=A0A4V1M4Y0_TREME|nr:hypothetical protein M231_00658 [Tremella mesenterica]